MALEVRPVAGKRDLSVFIELPWRLYRNERNWVFVAEKAGETGWILESTIR